MGGTDDIILNLMNVAAWMPNLHNGDKDEALQCLEWQSDQHSGEEHCVDGVLSLTQLLLHQVLLRVP